MAADGKRKPQEEASPNAPKRQREAVDPPAPSARRESSANLTEDEGSTPTPAADIASKDAVLQVVNDNKPVILLDVRTPEEVVNDGFLQTAGSGCSWLHVSCTREDAPLLRAAAPHMISDKKTPILVYCKSGKRAAKAQEILNGQGYANVTNAGGYKDLDYLQEALDKKKKEKE
ncbi:expressed unknown protein [Seminavis robusta]|uniref:Rhodanese domain-containing protein n=1 Tax=Seminavis robusta TaxID=568900 RepID=A0A9N8E9W2_9STRA|nr:expressed unknown protein [Seminavis robusta]|eukprot:Sro859_g211990.1 n/a (174) ;mRNA; f:23094-23694